MTLKIKRKLLFCAIALLSCFNQTDPLPAYGMQAQPVSMEIAYHMPDAGEVFLVWGINGWSILPGELRPSGTTVRDSLMYTPMGHSHGRFFAKIQAPRGATIDFVFQITKKPDGSPVSVWDTNSRHDYHAVATEGGKFEIEKKTLNQAESPQTDSAAGIYFLAEISIILLVCIILNLAFRRKLPRPPENPALKVLCTGISLFCFLVFIRAHITGISWKSFSSPLFMPRIFLAGYYDFAYTGTLTAIFIAMIFTARRYKNIHRLLYPSYALIALFSLFVAFLNIKIVEMLGRPFTYQWLYYSDFLRSLDAQNAVLSNLSWILSINVLSLCWAMAIFSGTVNLGIHLLHRKIKRPFLLAILSFGLVLVYLPLARGYVISKSRDYPRLENPVVSFFHSFIISRKSPLLFTMETPVGPEDFQLVNSVAGDRFYAPHSRDIKIRNVIFFVLESVPAEYMDTFGGKRSLTPELTKHLHQAASFKNIYAHAPSTNKSLVSLLCSVYPWISYESLTQTAPSIGLPSLSADLKRQGYRTAFISSGDNRFQNVEAFLSYRQFDMVKDFRNLDCNREGFVVKQDRWDFSDGTDDECVVNAFAQWAGEERKQPFFAILWTYQTHYPYFVSGSENNYGAESGTFNRYLNALHHSDYVLGRLLRWLEKRGLSESTLVVVVGDHGEAFGRHDQWGHASRIYEENIHVPLFLINKRLFRGEEYSTPGGLIDVAPTVMDILDLPMHAQRQGRSLFRKNRTDRVYFFSPWSSYLFGFRQKNLKFIFNASNNTSEVYDLNRDPEEKQNLAAHLPEFVSEGKMRLAAWVQFQNRYQLGLREMADNKQGH